MTILQLTVEESLAEAAREKAAAEGKTLERWLTEAVIEKMDGSSKHWVDKFFEIGDRAKGDSEGRKWTRSELYDE